MHQLFFLGMFYRCILDGEMLVWDTTLSRFAEFGSNQEIGSFALFFLSSFLLVFSF